MPVPLLSGLLVVLDKGFLKSSEWYYWLFSYIGFSLFLSLCALIFFGLPSLILAVIYATLRLRRCAKHVVFVALSGGTAAFMFNGLFMITLPDSVAFALGLVTSLLAAVFALPKQPM